MRRASVRRLRRWLYIGHRWIGIATCLLFAMWFVSGVVMMYVAFPHLTAQERVSALPDLDWSKVAVTPDRAMAVAGLKNYPRELRLGMLNDEPVYQISGWGAERRVVSAHDGRIIDHITRDEALNVARRYPDAANVRFISTVIRDQWSVTARFDPLRPLFLIALGDAAGTQLYVSERSGEIVLDTTRTERIWNWLGSIPHWIYPTILRKDGRLWREFVLWISGICMIVAASGIWIGILRVRLRRRYWANSISPYRGWKAWHHVTGFFAGVFVLTWIFSGWLSLNPGGFFAEHGVSREMAQLYARHETPDIVAAFGGQPQGQMAEARLVWLGGRPLMIAIDRTGTPRVLDPASGAPAPLNDTQIFAAAQHLMPKAEMTMRHRLASEDAYWYSHHEQRVLPVLRVGFDDAEQSWFHVDPRSGDILGRSDRGQRTYRWLFNAPHSLDFHALIAHRPAWDIVVWLLSLLGLVISTSGVVIGWRRLTR